MRIREDVIGGARTGPLLSHLLSSRKIDGVPPEQKTGNDVLSCIRACVPEYGRVGHLNQAACVDRLHVGDHARVGTSVFYGDDTFHIDLAAQSETPAFTYGQTVRTRDRRNVEKALRGRTGFEVDDSIIHEADGPALGSSYTVCKDARRIARFVASGCDGCRGVGRRTMPPTARREYTKAHLCSRRATLSTTPSIDNDLNCARSDRAFTSCANRSGALGWTFIRCRHGDSASDCADAIHIAPPTGAKGLNSDRTGPDGYPATAPRCVQKTARFTCCLPSLPHLCSDPSAFVDHIQMAEHEILPVNEAVQRAMAQGYAELTC